MGTHLHPANIINPQPGQSVRYNGTEWVNEALTSLAAATVSGDMNAANLVATLTQVRADLGWSFVANEAVYAGSPNSVDISVNIYLDGVVGQRATPRVRLQRKNGASGAYANIAIGDVYVRDASGAEEGNISITHTDPTPGVDPIYRLFTLQGATPGNTVNATDDETSFSLRAWVS